MIVFKKKVEKNRFFKLFLLNLKNSLIYCADIIGFTKWALAHFFLGQIKNVK
tara:strand:+ start:265 stop:420 length:156 start_codon:yes stop_codon:yes gene_type:complete